MDDAKAQRWAVLRKDDSGVQEEILALLAVRVSGNPYGSDSSFAEQLQSLPLGLKSMAATHWLDVSLTLDSITWHFGNFGEPGLVVETEAGLVELGLTDLAACFREAKDLMLPLLSPRIEADSDTNELLERKGLQEVANRLNQRAWALTNAESGESVIYKAWVQYAREHPERVFDI